MEDGVTAANRGVVLAKRLPRKPNARLDSRLVELNAGPLVGAIASNLEDSRGRD